ncbi:hypothetical protein [Nonomuraea sp. bgisy101]
MRNNRKIGMMMALSSVSGFRIVCRKLRRIMVAESAREAEMAFIVR